MEKKRVQTHRALLTEDDVREIRASSDDLNTIALKYGVSHQAVWECRARKTWKHVHD